MSAKFEKLKTLLRELFQLDQPDLDFGLYRILHARAAEVTRFLDQDLLPQVRQAFGVYQSADKAELEKELAKLVAGIQAAGMDPEQSPKVRELRARLAAEAVDVAALEAEVYDHLFTFFRRYYSEGDFLAKRVYKPGVYAIPYEGEEVALHWANKDQYYIKTGEYLRDYAFRLRPHDELNPRRVHFRLTDAAEGEHGNVKAAEGKERVFLLAPGVCMAEEDGELVIRFEYRPATAGDRLSSDTADLAEPEDKAAKPPKQKDLIAQAVQRVLANREPALQEWVRDLAQPHVTTAGEKADYTRLEAHLRRYTARNTFDYFIHKDLGGFLRRELDFFIKTEVMHLEDVESETAPRVEQYLSKIKVIRRIAGKVIDFLAQLENFQKKLWLKKKFVVETRRLVRLDLVPDAFLPEICANAAQREAWVRLHAIDTVAGDLAKTAYSAPLTPAFLREHPSLMVDTGLFPPAFSDRLVQELGDLEEKTDGVLVNSENFQGINLLAPKFNRQVRCIYIDPPYNTGGDGFNYKDNYQHSSWISLVLDRVELAARFLEQQGIHYSSIDDRESHRLRMILEAIFREENFTAEFVWQKRYAPDVRKAVSDAHEYIIAFAYDNEQFKLVRKKLPLTEAQTSQFKNPDKDARGPWKADNFTAPGFRPNQMYPIMLPSGRVVTPPQGRCWKVTEPVYRQLLERGLMYFGSDGDGLPADKRFLSEMDGMVPWTWWDHEEAGHSQDGLKEVMKLFGRELGFMTAKPPKLIERLFQISTEKDSIIFDYFSGSGTSAHAAINLNREDSGRRKFLLIEMADYFDTVLVPRIQKVCYTPEWKDGKPRRLATAEEVERGPRVIQILRLESYEDTLNNLALARSPAQENALGLVESQGPDRLREQYLLNYLLEVESRGSASLLNARQFADPTAYRLKVKRPGSDESREAAVDLLETFHWLIGLRVAHLSAPAYFTADFARDGEGRLRLKGRLTELPSLTPDPRPLPPDSPAWWFRPVSGTLPDGRKVLVLWRNRPSGETPEGMEQDNLVLDTWFTKQGYSSHDSEFGLIYVNGDNNLENLKTPQDQWKVRLIEEDFHRLMFEGTE